MAHGANPTSSLLILPCDQTIKPHSIGWTILYGPVQAEGLVSGLGGDDGEISSWRWTQAFLMSDHDIGSVRVGYLSPHVEWEDGRRYNCQWMNGFGDRG